MAAGREKASSVFNKLYADMEALREAQRKKAEEARVLGGAGDGQGEKGAGVDLAKAGQAVQAVGSKAGAFVNSWAAWAGEKRKAAGWGKSGNGGGGESSPTSAGSGWGSGWGRGVKNRNSHASADEEREPMRGKRMSTGEGGYQKVPLNRGGGGRGSVSGESMLDGGGSDSGMSSLPQSPVQVRGRALSRVGPGPPGTGVGGSLGQNGGMQPVGTPVMLVKEVPVPVVPVIPEGKETEKTPVEEKRKSVGDVAVAVEKPPPRIPTPPVVAAATEEAAVAQGAWKDGV